MFEVSDRVRLKTGGPAMFVQCAENERVQAFWFNQGRLRCEWFMPADLLPADASAAHTPNLWRQFATA